MRTMATDSVDVLNENQISEFQHEEILENRAFVPEITTANSREFVEKNDEILGSTSKLTINLYEINWFNEPFAHNGVTSVLDILNRRGEQVFTIGHCPADENVQRLVIANSVGHGLMSFTTSGFFNNVCEIDGAGLLSFTQIQHFHGGYTLRDPYKELVRIRSGWLPFCACCLYLRASASMTITDLDGTKNGSIVLRGNSLSIHFIPNLNPKAKYMLLAASIRLISVYFSHSARRRNFRCLKILYVILALPLLIVVAVMVYSLRCR